MADQLYLSFWVRGYSEGNMLGHFERLLGAFPFSAAQPVSILRVYAIEFTEPPQFELSFDGKPGAGEIVRAASQFLNADSAYLVSGFWDLWQRESGWQLTPTGVVLGCRGPAFENEVGDHLRIELGLDTQFLPEPGRSLVETRVKSNIQSVLRLSRELEATLQVEKRRLWTESGENFADRLRDVLAAK
jgi:hypothetical protein